MLILSGKVDKRSASTFSGMRRASIWSAKQALQGFVDTCKASIALRI
jgi:hypothetical protein